ncbi:bifunctional transcriptional activator/DNA repair enzyme Ada [Zophobas morio]
MSSSLPPKITKLNPAAYKKLAALNLEYGTAPTKFGNCLGAFRGNALCYLSFFDHSPPSLDEMKKMWPEASFTENELLISSKLTKLFEDECTNFEIYLKGTDFEIEVWEALLRIKRGTTVSYEEVAKSIGRPKATRAAARAIARNNIAYFVPCHRVIRKDGSLHKYGGGPHRKAKMLRDEGAI